MNTPYRNTLDTKVDRLKRAAKAGNAVLVGKAVDSLRLEGYTYRECYRIAAAGAPDLTLAEFDDLLAEADS